MHDEEVQRRRTIQWQRNEQTKAFDSQNLQVQRHGIENQIEAEMCKTEHIRQWTCVLKN